MLYRSLIIQLRPLKLTLKLRLLNMQESSNKQYLGSNRAHQLVTSRAELSFLLTHPTAKIISTQKLSQSKIKTQSQSQLKFSDTYL